MFDQLSERLSRAVDSLRGRGRLTEDNVADTLRQVRMALLEADVAVPVVKAFTDAVKARAVGTEITKSLTPGQAFIKVIHDELVAVMGEPAQGLNLRAQPPVIILLAGLQGAGKTTTAAKLARHLIEKQKKRVLLSSTDVYRPAAMTQLERLAEQVGADYLPANPTDQPVGIARAAVEHARRYGHDVLIVDTAGRLHVDAEMMSEVQEIDRAIEPLERLFVVDSMAGQDAVNAARAFNDALALTGVILTKADGDARGGAALSVRHVTGKPILFLGVGEKTEALEVFHPERVASRILGMGDVLSLVEQVQSKVDQEKAEKVARKLVEGKGFDFNDLREQLQQFQSMGGLASIMDKLPTQMLPAAAAGKIDDRLIRRQIAIINSMTPRERRRPAVIDGSRKRRIAAGSGLQVQEVNRLLKQFTEMERVMKKMKGGGLKKMLRGLGGRFPGGFGPGGFGPGGPGGFGRP
ncbi:MAG: signal recognition particle protein [Gammaproteobacteria bacterium]|nr:signal recognition particle protein [Gammaproteobacteria bacterium]